MTGLNRGTFGGIPRLGGGGRTRVRTTRSRRGSRGWEGGKGRTSAVADATCTAN